MSYDIYSGQKVVRFQRGLDIYIDNENIQSFSKQD